MFVRSDDILTREAQAFDGGCPKESASRQHGATISCCRGTPRLDPSCTTGWPDPSAWNRSVGGATAEGGSRATTCSRSARRGCRRSGICGEGSGRAAIGSTRGRRLCVGCGRRMPQRLFWGFWGARVGCRASAEMARARVDEGRGEEVARGTEGGKGGPGPP